MCVLLVYTETRTGRHNNRTICWALHGNWMKLIRYPLKGLLSASAVTQRASGFGFLFETNIGVGGQITWETWEFHTSLWWWAVWYYNHMWLQVHNNGSLSLKGHYVSIVLIYVWHQCWHLKFACCGPDLGMRGWQCGKACVARPVWHAVWPVNGVCGLGLTCWGHNGGQGTTWSRHWVVDIRMALAAAWERHIKKMALAGYGTYSLVLLCAFIGFLDFGLPRDVLGSWMFGLPLQESHDRV
ncbi:hypothetical protein E3N88_26283 [Mikania micrantha]|uniref:Uncharacterized protein n=1 Tax=Mikania micrantha TaxID=192012 RepID=A0A5N6N793_9ASTR|nr:hypothetical protein E3N88_26283 [Mikania micrantha]